jgi:hypothetical protein
MIRPEDLIRPSQRQLTEITAGLFGRFPPRRLCHRLTELHLAAWQQPPSRIRTPLLPDERDRIPRSRHNHQGSGYDPPRGLFHHTPASDGTRLMHAWKSLRRRAPAPAVHKLP